MAHVRAPRAGALGSGTAVGTALIVMVAAMSLFAQLMNARTGSIEVKGGNKEEMLLRNNAPILHGVGQALAQVELRNMPGHCVAM